MKIIVLFLIIPSFLKAAVWAVKPGDSIQSMIQKAQPGDRVEVQPGTYHENLIVDKSDISLIGKIQDGSWPVLDGEKKLNDGVIVSGSGFLMEGFYIRNYKGNGIMTQGANRVTLRKLFVHDTGIYGIYPARGANIVVEDTVAWGIEDAAIYIGMCTHVDVRRNQVFGNVAGIEIENSTYALVENNSAYDNSGGIMVFALPGLPLKKTEEVIVRNNTIVGNNHKNFGAPGSVVAGIPPGTGLMLLAADRVVVEGNIIQDNDTAGILIADLDTADLAPDPEVEKFSDGNLILKNILHNNGRCPRSKARWLLLLKFFSWRGADIVATAPGKQNCIATDLEARRLGTTGFGNCDGSATSASIQTQLAEGVGEDLLGTSKLPLGDRVFFTVCSLCHAYGMRSIGPSIKEIQQKYKEDPKGIMAYAKKPSPVRKGFPPMPPQAHLGEEKLKAVAEYMLKLSH